MEALERAARSQVHRPMGDDSELARPEVRLDDVVLLPRTRKMLEEMAAWYGQAVGRRRSRSEAKGLADDTGPVRPAWPGWPVC